MPLVRCHDCDREFTVSGDCLGPWAMSIVRGIRYFVCPECAKDIELDQVDEWGEAVAVRGELHLRRFVDGALVARRPVPLPPGGEDQG